MIRTEHTVRMLKEAATLAELVQVADETAGIEHQEQHLPGHPGGETTWTALERAANLARHAAAELEDELLRARYGWPVV